MPSHPSNASMIAIDWGSTNCRAWLMENGRILARRERGCGITQTSKEGFPQHLEALIAPWAHQTRDCVIFGMITSKSGWVETPYAECPVELSDLAERVVMRDHGPWRLTFVPGVSQRSPRYDVIRGEELQAFGVTASTANSSVLLLPGTHSKWVRMSGDKIEAFHTSMTGELYALLLQRSLVGAAALGDSFFNETFTAAVRQALASPSGQFDLFEARPRVLLGDLPAEHVASHLSGLLIGREIAEARTILGTDDLDQITIVGASNLATKYSQALRIAGLPMAEATEDLGGAGAWHLWTVLQGSQQHFGFTAVSMSPGACQAG